MRPTPKPPKLPQIDVWIEPVDQHTVALFACRQWDRAPRLTVWRLVDLREEDVWRHERQRKGAAMLFAFEQRCNARWYKYAQRQFELWVNQYAGDPQACYQVQQFYALPPPQAVNP